MTNLHEQYETLLRRGMPGHPRLRHDVVDDSGCDEDALWFLRHAEPTECPPENSESGVLDDILIRPSDALDLVTMHALRWFLGMSRHDDKYHEQITLAQWTTYQSFSLVVDTEGLPPAYSAQIDADWPILDAILAATEHLEPADG